MTYYVTYTSIFYTNETLSCQEPPRNGLFALDEEELRVCPGPWGVWVAL